MLSWPTPKKCFNTNGTSAMPHSGEQSELRRAFFLRLRQFCMVVWMAVTLIGTSSSMQKPVAQENQGAQRWPNGPSASSVRTASPNAVGQVGVGSSTSPPAANSPSYLQNLFDLTIGATVSLNRDVPVQAGSRVITLAGGHRMTFLGREGRDAARVRYVGADYIVPLPPFGPHHNA